MKRAIGFLLGAAMLVVGSSAHALSVGITGSASGSVGVGGVGVQASTSFQSGTSGNSSSMNMNGSANMDMGLQAQIQALSTDTSSVDAVVQLQGNTAALIQSEGDLNAYNNLVIKERPAVTAINVDNNNNIAIDYSQPAKLFGVFSTSLSGQVDVDAQGNTSVHLPWYAIFYAKNTVNVKTSVATAVQESGANFGAQADAGAQLQNSARVISAVTAALQSQAQAEANVSASAAVQ